MRFVFALCVLSLGCAQQGHDALQRTPSTAKVTREFLLAHGFQQKWKETDPDIYDLETTRLSDVLRDLGLSVEDFYPTVNRPDSFDWRDAQLEGMYVRVEPHVQDRSGTSFGKTDSPCTVRVWLNVPPPRDYLKTESSPRIRVKSVAVANDPSKPLQVTFELSAEGATPLAVSSGDFYIELRDAKSPQHTASLLAYFPEGTPLWIRVWPTKPIVLTATTRDSPFEGMGPDGRPSGEYRVEVRIYEFKPDRPGCDYHWQGEKSSDEYTLVIK
jgi:hypothetical protein